MSKENNNKQIGEVLLELGRISAAEIERALEHQRLEGGYFGQALVDLGIIEQAALDSGLASQADIPYVRPQPDSIDPEVASLMPPIWAQRHNALPIARKDGWLTLLVDSPLKSGLADELARRTGLSVKLALCSTRTIADTIRQVFRLEPEQQESSRVLSLEAFWSLATSPPALRWGLTVRRNQVIGWICNEGRIQRHRLMHNWLVFLDRLLSPPASQVLPPHGLREWRASVRPDQSPAAVMVHSLSGPGGHDLVFEPAVDDRKTISRLPSGSQLAILKQALSHHATVIGVHSPTGEAARELVTNLPRLLLSPEHRSVCLLGAGVHAISDDMLVVAPPDDGEQRALLGFLERLGLDAVGLEIKPDDELLWQRALKVAPLVMIVLSGLKDEDPLPPGINWLLSKAEERQPDWDLI